jgi:hypothetical protein
MRDTTLGPLLSSARLVALAPLVALTLVACEPTDQEPDPGNGGQFGEETDSGCQVLEELAIGLDDITDLGFSAQDMLDVADGDHSADLTWADGAAAALSLGVSGATNPRVLDYEYVSDGSGAEPAMDCTDGVAVDLTLAVVTDDGLLDESFAVTLVQWEGEQFPTLNVDLDDLSGTLDAWDFATESFDEVWADLSIAFETTGVSGEIKGYGETAWEGDDGDDGVVSMSMFEIASF